MPPAVPVGEEVVDANPVDATDVPDALPGSTPVPAHELFSQVPKDRRSHLDDFNKVHSSSPLPTNIYIYPALTYANYVQRAVANFLMTFFFEPTMPVFHPFNTLLMITVVPAFIFGLLFAEIALRCATHFGLDNIINDIGKKWGGNLSPVNWWDPRIFQPEMKEIVEDAKKALNDSHDPMADDNDVAAGQFPTMQPRGFNIDIAELLLLFSSIVYERNQTLVDEAHQRVSELANNPERATAADYAETGAKLMESEKRIHEQAAMWGVRFTSMSELNSMGGPFAGMFWSEEYNFITVVFKGTTPTDYEDFLIDFMWQRTDARSYLFGNIHEGFYTSLFPETSHGSARSNRASPYFTIVRAMRAKAVEIRSNRKLLDPQNDDKVNVWVTGHSLGSALASLFFARTMHSPGDMGNNCILRDAYLFGTPMVGDGDWAAAFTSVNNRPFDRNSTMWRIVDDTDIITHIPPGYNDPNVGRFISKYNVFNFTHVGESIRFFQDGRPPVSTRNIFASGKEPIIVQRNKGSWSAHEPEGNGNRSSRKNVFEKAYDHPEGSPLHFVENWLLPTFFRNHLPARYFHVMQKARFYLDDNDEGTIVPQVEKTI